jgi:hypothetical protein
MVQSARRAAVAYRSSRFTFAELLEKRFRAGVERASWNTRVLSICGHNADRLLNYHCDHNLGALQEARRELPAVT